MGNLGWLVHVYSLLKDDMPFVSGSYMIEVNDYVEKSGLFFSKKNKNEKNGSWSFPDYLGVITYMTVRENNFKVSFQKAT